MDQLKQKIDEILTLSNADVFRAAGLLVQYAEEYAVNPKLKRDCVLFAMEVNETTLQGDYLKSDVIKTRIAALVEEITEDCLSNPDKDSTLKKKNIVRNFYINQAPESDAVFEAKNIGKVYAGAKNFHLRGVNLTLKLGQITGVVGENGNGKTTLLKIIGGLLSPDKGTELKYPFLKEKELEWTEIKGHIGYVPQRINPWNGNVIDNMLFMASIKGIAENKIQSEVDYIIDRLGLSEYKNRKWHELSGGYQMRFELAKTLLWNPKLLILDEPLANLDIKTQSLFLRDLRQLANSIKKCTSIIISSQHLYRIESISDQIIFLKQGEAIYNGSVADLGKDRMENCFELCCSAHSSELYPILKTLGVNRIVDEGGDMLLLFTPKELQGGNILNDLIRSGIEIKYFRDSSKSTRPLFETV